MSDMLKKHLVEEAEKHSNLKLLESQWGFDEKLIPKALQAVGQLFPHFSRHDQSHSDQILINIERMLGKDRVELLSATDTWLLLEAAYWHDLGMVVPKDALDKVLKTKEFKRFCKEIAGEKRNEISNFAKHFDGSDVSKAFLGAETPLDAMEKLRWLLAEWFRRQHSSRSEQIANAPAQELGLNSPRTELIPQRLFRLLGIICSLHGGEFSSVIDKLPHKEVGMANDDCHPRFVACLLRLGDLLDLDDNRFCPVMIKMVGESRPILSKAHEEKHRSIVHFNLNPKRIEISAVCATIEGYLEQWNWLDYLRDEIRDQMARWQDIAPSMKLGLLPTLGSIDVKIAGRQLITQPGSRPQFVLNSSRVMELLKGENIYQHEDAVREILQNAVDATLLHIWVKSKQNGIPVKKISDVELIQMLDSHFISVCLEEIVSKNISPEKTTWRLTVTDQGVGIGYEEIPYIMNIAGSSLNPRRQNLIDEMPEWLQPSGAFGIGLQSVFMWSDIAKVQTKSYYSSDALDITLHSPTGPKAGLVAIESVEDSHMIATGTMFSFEFVTDVRPKKYSIKNTEVFTDDANYLYDRLLDNRFPVRAFKVLDAINNFTLHSPVKIKWIFKDTFHTAHSKEFVVQNDVDTKCSFIDKHNCKFEASIFKYSNRGGSGSIYYRGQYVYDAKPPSFRFFNYRVDLYSGKAGDWVTFNRSGLTSEGNAKVSSVVRDCIKQWIDDNLEFLLEKYPAEVSILAHCWASDDTKPDIAFWESIARKAPREWLKIDCQILEKRKVTQKTYYDVMQKDMVIYDGSYSVTKTFGLKSPKLAFMPQAEASLCIKHWCSDKSHGLAYVAFTVKEHSFSSIAISPKLIEVNEQSGIFNIDNDVLKSAIEARIRYVLPSHRLLLPICIFPDELGVSRLRLKEDLKLSGVEYVFDHLPHPMAHILLPFEICIRNRGAESSIGLDRFEDFIKWVSVNLSNPQSLEEIRNHYEAIVRYFDDDVMKESDSWKKIRKRSERNGKPKKENSNKLNGGNGVSP